MRVAIVGAGVVGVTTAFELAADGHEVVVFERCSSVAAEASFASAGIAAPGWLVSSLAAGAAARESRGGRFERDGALQAAAGLTRLLSTSIMGWRSRRAPDLPATRDAMLALARISQERLARLTRSLSLDYEHGSGITLLLRGDRELARARPMLKLLAELGLPFELLNAERARRVEPGLDPDTALRAAVHLPQDGVGNCRLFAQQLKHEAARRGADFRFGVTVERIAPGARPVLAAAGREEAFDAVVLCSGAASAPLLRALRVRLSLRTVRSCTVTAPLRQLEGYPDLGPRSAIRDEAFGVTVTRLGRRLRVAGRCDARAAGQADERTLRRLYRVLDDWFPGAYVGAQAQQWTGARATSPDGLPVLGASGAPGVWLNLGHGASGWALACGSARVLADQLARRPAPAELAGLTIERLR